MVLQILAPRVEHTQHADPGAQLFRIGRDLAERGRARAEQQIVHDLLILERQPRELMRQREDHMRVLTRQEFGPSFVTSHASRARVRHFGQCRLPHELKEMAR